MVAIRFHVYMNSFNNSDMEIHDRDLSRIPVSGDKIILQGYDDKNPSIYKVEDVYLHEIKSVNTSNPEDAVKATCYVRTCDANSDHIEEMGLGSPELGGSKDLEYSDYLNLYYVNDDAKHGDWKQERDKLSKDIQKRLKAKNDTRFPKKTQYGDY